MGLLISKLAEAYGNWNDTPARILLLGLDNAGKTTCLYKLKLNETVSTIPTIGFNVETVQPVPGLTMTVWDVGGQEKLRGLWRHYYHGVNGLIWVIDSNDPARIEESREEFMTVINDDSIPRGVPLLIFANKQDLPQAVSTSKIVDMLGLHSLRGHKWHVQASNAVTGDGLCEGMNIMSKMTKEFIKSNPQY